MKRGRGLRRGPGPSRKTRLKAINRKRRAQRYERDYGGPKGDFIRGFRCELCGGGPTEAAHAIPRSRGGKADQLVPLCRDCHRAHDEYRLPEGQRATVAMAAGRFETLFQEWLATRTDGDLSF